MKKITVVGSVNADLVSFVRNFPEPGETVSGEGFGMYQGGKGANQAVAAARLGAEVRMVGAVGNDFLGDFLIGRLYESGVDVSCVPRVEGTSGVADIRVDSSGENSIIVDSGANSRVDAGFPGLSEVRFEKGSYLLLQLEIPPGGVALAAENAKKSGASVILDPAPAAKLPGDLLKKIDFITPNEIEISRISTGADLGEMMARLEAKGPKVIVKAGKRGVFILDGRNPVRLPAFEAEAVDTTGAGDCFNAALAVALSDGAELAEACRFAMAAAALSITKKGAGPSFPKKKEVLDFLGKNR